jgi:hypothetical protein
MGLLIVVQNILSSSFNSHLFDFNESWMYVFGVGIVGGIQLRRQREISRQSLEPDVRSASNTANEPHP